MNKTRVDIETILALKEALNVINRLKIDDIQFYKKGKPIKMNNLEDFKLMGLNNTDYAIGKFWKKPKVIYPMKG